MNALKESMQLFDINIIRKDFPILNETVHGKTLVYLDNAATTQKPEQVIEAMNAYYRHTNSNIHRGVHLLSEKATQQYEEARKKVARLIGAPKTQEIIFTRGTTDAINLLAASFGKKHIQAGDEILISAMEHHSNIVPWQMMCEERKAVLKVVPIDDDGSLNMEAFEQLLSEKTKLVAIVHVSNSLGTINPVKEIIQKAHAKNIPVLLDGAQAVQHLPVNVQELDCDFYAFSGHKLFGPTGVGVLYGKEAWLKDLPPYQGGGDMILNVTFEKTTYNELPYKFEAGTPAIAEVIGLGAAIDYISGIGMKQIETRESELLAYAMKRIAAIPRVTIIGTAAHKSSVVSFVVDGVHPHDMGTILDREGIAIRTGHHCTQPVMKRFGIPATSRVSLAFYNTEEELDTCVKAIEKAIQLFV